MSISTKNCVEYENTQNVSSSVDKSIEISNENLIVTVDSKLPQVSNKELPADLSDYIESLVQNRISGIRSDIANKNNQLLDALASLRTETADYLSLLDINATVDRVLATKLDYLYSQINNNNADIARLQSTLASKDTAAALIESVISSSIDNGAIASAFGSTSLAIATLDSAIAEFDVLLTSSFNDIDASIQETFVNQATLDSSLVSYQEYIQASIGYEDDPDSLRGYISKAESDLTVLINNTRDMMQAMFKYNATVKIGDFYYSSGFGLYHEAMNSNQSSNTVVDSEFWVKADVFNFYSSNSDKSIAPFSIHTRTDNGLAQLLMERAVLVNNGFPYIVGDIPSNYSNGFRLSSVAAGTKEDPSIFGGYIRGSKVYGTTISGALIKFGTTNYIDGRVDSSDPAAGTFFLGRAGNFISFKKEPSVGNRKEFRIEGTLDVT